MLLSERKVGLLQNKAKGGQKADGSTCAHKHSLHVSAVLTLKAFIVKSQRIRLYLISEDAAV